MASVLHGLRGGVETRPMFDRRAMPVYAVLLFAVAGTLALMAFGGFRFAGAIFIFPPAWCGALVVAGLLARRYGHPQTGGACEAIGLLYSESIVIGASTPMLTAYSAPIADDALARADHMLGFDWHSYAMLFRDHPVILRLVGAAYMSFLWQAVVILIALFAIGKSDRAWRFVTAAAIALVITVAVYPLAPAVGGFVHFGITPEMYHNLRSPTPWSFAPAIHAMQSGTKIITPDLLVGYVSFPSYHAASAVLFAWAAWPLKRWRWLFVAVNICMAASAMIIGAHYFVDLLGGAVVAVLGLAIANAIQGRLSRAGNHSQHIELGRE